MRYFREYPKLILICLSMVVAYAVYALGGLHWLDNIPTTAEYVAVFISGVLFSFGFTSPFGIGVFLEIGHMVNPFLAGVLGGLGSLIADLLIFEVMRFEFFHDELHRIRATPVVQKIHAVLHHEKFPEQLRRYLLWSFAGIIIASPLPDEFGVILVSSLTNMRERTFAVFCFTINTAAITLMLMASGALAS